MVVKVAHFSNNALVSSMVEIHIMVSKNIIDELSKECKIWTTSGLDANNLKLLAHKKTVNLLLFGPRFTKGWTKKQ
jgi:phage pi2 protein 07